VSGLAISEEEAISSQLSVKKEQQAISEEEAISSQLTENAPA